MREFLGDAPDNSASSNDTTIFGLMHIHAEVQPGWVPLGFDHRKNHTTLAPDEGNPNYDALALNREYIFSIFNGYY